MRNIVTVLGFFVIQSLHALDVSVTTLNYYQGESYIEIYSRILGHSAQFSSTNLTDSLHTAQIEMLLLIKEKEKIVVADKYMISSPASLVPIDFWDMKRYSLSNGEYELELVYVDQNNPVDTVNYSSSILINHAEAYLSSSDILVTKAVSSDLSDYPFQRSGFSYEPLAYNLYNEADSTFSFYLELYNIQGLDEGRYYRFFIRDSESKEQITKPAYKKLKTIDDCFILESFDISNIGTGNYELNFEVVNQAKEVLHQNTQRFSVYHPLVDYKFNMKPDANYETSFVHILDEGEVNYALKAIFPRVNNKMSGMLNSLIWSDELEPKRYFLYSFWTKFNAENVKTLFDQYMDVARAVDMEFASNIGHGFETDRGYIFLKYGKPDDLVSVEDEPSAPPYEIWIYNYLEETQQTAVKFLFYNPSIVANDFLLLHSTCRGELHNPQWELELYSKDNMGNNSNRIDQTEVGDNFNRNAKRYFTDF